MLARAAGYAAAALGQLATNEGKPLLVKKIAQACGIPQAYLAKIVNVLARRGLVITQRGIGGGVCLARSAADITLHDLCEALGDPIVQAACSNTLRAQRAATARHTLFGRRTKKSRSGFCRARPWHRWPSLWRGTAWSHRLRNARTRDRLDGLSPASDDRFCGDAKVSVGSPSMTVQSDSSRSPMHVR